jgi:hypothetical protein
MASRVPAQTTAPRTPCRAALVRSAARVGAASMRTVAPILSVLMRQQLGEDQPQTVDIIGGHSRCWRQLSAPGWHSAASCSRRPSPRPSAPTRHAMPKSSTDTGNPLWPNQDVGWLQIAVQHQSLVRESAQLGKSAGTSPSARPVRAIVRDTNDPPVHAFDILHHQMRTPAGICATVQQTAQCAGVPGQPKSGVHGESALFVFWARQGTQALDRTTLLVLPIAALGQIDTAPCRPSAKCRRNAPWTESRAWCQLFVQRRQHFVQRSSATLTPRVCDSHTAQ